MTTAEKIKIMQAYEDGKQVEFFCPNSGEWITLGEPVWNWENYKYRIKPPALTLSASVIQQIKDIGFIPNDWIGVTDRKVVYVDEIISLLENLSDS